MHLSSYLELEAFLEEHAGSIEATTPKSILDIGSASYKGHRTYRIPAEKRGLRYVGLDMQAGPNVDIVPKNPVVYSEIADESFDFVVSGQAFEHNPFFWVSYCEIARILKPGGVMMVIAPSAGSVHRFPFDCWRYYPDSWMALCAISGLEYLESIFEPDAHRLLVEGAKWRDSAVVAQKPHFDTQEARRVFYDRLRRFTLPFEEERFRLSVLKENTGPVFSRYSKIVSASTGSPVTS